LRFKRAAWWLTALFVDERTQRDRQFVLALRSMSDYVFFTAPCLRCERVACFTDPFADERTTNATGDWCFALTHRDAPWQLFLTGLALDVSWRRDSPVFSTDANVRCPVGLP
jgi:hypothetical protein